MAAPVMRFAGALAVASILTGCHTTASNPEAQPSTGQATPPPIEILVALAQDLTSNGAGIGRVGPLNNAQADCLARGIVDSLGSDRLAAYGLPAGGDSPSVADTRVRAADARLMARAVLDCFDVRSFIDDISEGALAQLPPRSQRCLDKEYTEEVLLDFLAPRFSEGDYAYDGLRAGISTCFAPPKVSPDAAE